MLNSMLEHVQWQIKGSSFHSWKIFLGQLCHNLIEFAKQVGVTIKNKLIEQLLQKCNSRVRQLQSRVVQAV